MLAGHLEQVSSDRVQPVVIAHAIVNRQFVEELQRLMRPFYHRDGNRAVEPLSGLGAWDA